MDNIEPFSDEAIKRIKDFFDQDSYCKGWWYKFVGMETSSCKEGLTGPELR